MSRRSLISTRGLVAVLPAAVVVAALASAPWWKSGPAVADSAEWWMLPLLACIAAGASSFAPLGRWSLGLGAMALPPAMILFGPTAAAWIAVAGHLLGSAARWIWFDRRDPKSRPGLESLIASTSRLGVAALAAGFLWQVLWASTESSPTLAMASGLAGGIYLAVMGSLRVAEKWVGERSFNGSALAPLALDFTAWIIGTVAARTVVVLDWSGGLLPLVALAGLALEAARNRGLRRRAVQRVRDLWSVTRAGYRISVSGSDLGEIAAQVLGECLRVVPLEWFEFAVPQADGELTSWCAGHEKRIETGVPDPPAHPPVLPGFHRQVSWKILERPLVSDGEEVAELRLWCDPRRLDSTSVELLDSLLPQIASAVHRALLDRRANLDDLTGLADRGAFEERISLSYANCCEMGEKMAIVLADLDRFKRINDRWGHQAGDRTLEHLARVLEEHRREGDLCARYGGEEFVVVLEGADAETALAVAERLRLAVESSKLEFEGHRIRLRLSAGVAAFPELYAKEAGGLVQLADEALYEAKRRGRNQVLLNLGRGRFQSPDGKVREDEQPRLEMKPPTLFA